MIAVHNYILLSSIAILCYFLINVNHKFSLDEVSLPWHLRGEGADQEGGISPGNNLEGELFSREDELQYPHIPYNHRSLNELPPAALKVLESINRLAMEMPKMGLTLVLPHLNHKFSMAMHQDIYNLAPQGYNNDPVMLLSSQYQYPLTLNSQRFRNTYVVEEQEGVPMIIQAFYFVKSLSKYRNKVLILSGDSIVDWEKFVDTGLSEQNIDNMEVECLIRGESIDGDDVCDSFNGLYSIELIDRILKHYAENYPQGINTMPATDWYRWLFEDLGVMISPVVDILTEVYKDPGNMWRDMMLRDPRYQDLIALDDATVVQDMPNLIRRLHGHYVDYIREPTFIVLPDVINCSGPNGVFMVQSVVNASGRRTLLRQYFKSLHITDYFFLVGVPTITYTQEAQEEFALEIATHQDIVQYNMIDSYDVLLHKMFASLTFVKNYCPDAKALIKIDHDVVLLPSKFLVKDHTSFGNEGALLDFERYSDVTCLYGIFRDVSEVFRGDLPYGVYSVPYRQWPFHYHPSYCSGPFYMLKMDSVLRIHKQLKTIMWYGDPSVTYKFATLNEDSMVTGLYRELAGGNIGFEYSGEHYSRLNSEEFKNIFLERSNGELKLGMMETVETTVEALEVQRGSETEGSVTEVPSDMSP